MSAMVVSSDGKEDLFGGVEALYLFVLILWSALSVMSVQTGLKTDIALLTARSRPQCLLLKPCWLA